MNSTFIVQPKVRCRRGRLLLILVVALLLQGAGLAQNAPLPAPPQAVSILDYIHKSWDTLSCSMTDCHSLADPKLNGDLSVLYLPPMCRYRLRLPC